jgi:hypothetical protein
MLITNCLPAADLLGFHPAPQAADAGYSTWFESARVPHSLNFCELSKIEQRTNIATRHDGLIAA